MKLNFVWQIETGLYQSGEDLLINGIHIASCGYNSSMSRTNTDEFRKAHQYIGNILLPAKLGAVYKTIYAPTIEECHSIIERIVSNWFNQVLKEAEDKV